MNESIRDARLATASERTSSRFVGAVVCGFLASLFLSEAIRAGASFTYQSENAFEEWRQVVWGEHWMLRAMTAVLSAAWGGFIAGTVARRRGGLIGLVSSLPFVVLWGAAAYFAWQPDFVSPTAYRFVPFVLMAAIPYITSARATGALRSASLPACTSTRGQGRFLAYGGITTSGLRFC